MQHANLFVGSKTWAFSKLSPHLTVPSADVLIFDGKQLTIGEARNIIYEAGLRPVEGTHRNFIIACDKILPEAQNALLKLLEEPNSSSLFHIVIRSEDLLLPTLRSRLFLVEKEGDAREMETFEHFLRMSPEERLSLIADRVGEDDGVWVDEIIKGIESYAQKKRNGELMREVLQTNLYMRSTGSSKKMLLEHLALSL